MSEQLSNPENKLPQWQDNCNKCKKDYNLEPQNTMYVSFNKKPECNYVVCKCTHCGFNTMIFDQSVTINDVTARDLMIDDSDDYPSDQIYETWFNVNGYEKPQEYELTHRHEQLVKKFGETLSAMSEQAPELFWDEMNSPQPRPTMPQRWI